MFFVVLIVWETMAAVKSVRGLSVASIVLRVMNIAESLGTRVARHT
jgi:hypothetical protein